MKLYICRKFNKVMQENILVLGASGQIGTDLVGALRATYGDPHVIASDLKKPAAHILESGPFVELNAMDRGAIEETVRKYKITQVYHLVAMLSATAEKNPMKGWELNMQSLFHTLEMAREKKIQKLYWPSSIAAFGPTTPKEDTPQQTIMDPGTVYGISKLSGELWCQYYHDKYGVDVRGLRYPGLISYKAAPGGGTTDYAVEIFHQAKKEGKYECYLAADTALPMMYMPDAIKATVGIMEAPAEQVKLRTSYNVSAFSFDPANLANSVRKHIPDFEISYNVDERNAIALGWPQSIDDSVAREHWGWKPDYSLDDMVKEMLENV